MRNAKAAKKSDEMNKESFKDFNSLLYNGVHKSLSVFLVLVECVSLMRDDRIKYFGRILLLQLFFTTAAKRAQIDDSMLAIACDIASSLGARAPANGLGVPSPTCCSQE